MGGGKRMLEISSSISMQGRERAVEKMIFLYRSLIREMDEYQEDPGRGFDVNAWIGSGVKNPTLAEVQKNLCKPDWYCENVIWVGVIDRVYQRYEATDEHMAYMMRWFYRMDLVNKGADRDRVRRRNEIMEKCGIGLNTFYSWRHAISREVMILAIQAGVMRLK